jgi:hypothetical protein
MPACGSTVVDGPGTAMHGRKAMDKKEKKRMEVLQQKIAELAAAHAELAALKKG